MPRVSEDGINRSKLIREYKKANRNAKPREIAEALAKQGVEVDPQYISVVLSNAKRAGGKVGKRGRPRKAQAAEAAPVARKRGRGRPRKVAAAAPRSGGGEVSVADLMRAREFVASAGGADRAHRAIDTLNELLKS